jgi:hypothetical protein
VTEATTTTTAATTTAATTTQPAGHGIAWLPADADAELVGHVQNKGWQSAADAAKAHRAAEQLIGADRAGRTVTLPTDENDQPAWQKVWERLGRPANATDYKLPVPDGADPAFATEAATKFHELGVSTKQAQALSAWWNEKLAQVQQDEQKQLGQQTAEESAVLQKDWGAEKDNRMELARRAAVTLGLDAAAIDAMQRGGGYAKTMKALAKVGDMLREHGAEGMGDLGSFSMTPEGAAAKKKALIADKEWGKRAMLSGSPEWAELTKLNRIIASQQQA